MISATAYFFWQGHVQHFASRRMGDLPSVGEIVIFPADRPGQQRNWGRVVSRVWDMGSVEAAVDIVLEKVPPQ